EPALLCAGRRSPMPLRCVTRCTNAARARATLMCAALLFTVNGLAAPPKDTAKGPPPLQYSAVVDGPSVKINGKRAGQLAEVAFAAKGGQYVGIFITNLELTPSSASTLMVTVRDKRDQKMRVDRVRCTLPGATSGPRYC